MSDRKSLAFIIGINSKLIAIVFWDKVQILEKTPDYPADLKLGDFIDFRRRNQKWDSPEPLVEIYDIEKAEGALFEAEVVGKDALIADVNVIARDFYNFPQIYRLISSGKVPDITTSFWSPELGELQDTTLFEDQKKERGRYFEGKVRLSFAFDTIVQPVMTGDKTLKNVWRNDGAQLQYQKELISIGKESQEQFMARHHWTPWAQQLLSQDLKAGDGYQNEKNIPTPKTFAIVVHTIHVTDSKTTKAWSPEKGLLTLARSARTGDTENYLGNFVHIRTTITGDILAATSPCKTAEQPRGRLVSSGNTTHAQFVIPIRFPRNLAIGFSHEDDNFGTILIQDEILGKSFEEKNRTAGLAGKLVDVWIQYVEEKDRFIAVSLCEDQKPSQPTVCHSDPW